MHSTLSLFFSTFDTPARWALLHVGLSAIAFALSWLTVQVAVVPFRQSVGAHWTERARLLAQASRLTRLQHFAYAVNAAIFAYVGAIFSWWAYPVPISPYLTFILAALLGTYLTQYFLARAAYPEVTTPRIFIRQMLFNYAPLVIYLGMVFAISWELHATLEIPEVYAVGIAWAVLYPLSAFGGWLAPYRICGLLSKPPERVLRVVRATATAMEVPEPRYVFLLHSPWAYAAAMPTTKTLLYSTGILDLFDDTELAAVTAHEIMHLQESRGQILLRLLPGLMVVPLMLAIYAVYTGEHFWIVFAYLAVLFVTGRSVRSISRRLERRADAGAKAQESEGGAYARALERLYETRLVPATIPKRFQTHPDLYDRMLDAGVTPSYRRPPLPPRRQFYFGAVLTGALTFLLVVALLGDMLYRIRF